MVWYNVDDEEPPFIAKEMARVKCIGFCSRARKFEQRGKQGLTRALRMYIVPESRWLCSWPLKLSIQMHLLNFKLPQINMSTCKKSFFASNL